MNITTLVRWAAKESFMNFDKKILIAVAILNIVIAILRLIVYFVN